MARYAVFLRGINIGSRRVRNQDLLSCVEAIGFEEAAVFRASGNLVLEGGAGESVEQVKRRLERGLQKSLGFEVVAYPRSARQIKAIAALRPFPAKALRDSKGRFQVAFLAAKPSAAAKKEMLALATEKDLLAVRGTELYWLPSAGTQESELGMARIDKTIGPMTLRTMGTIEEIVARYFS
jgi:uncharacterized protein (DUF1697 family)